MPRIGGHHIPGWRITLFAVEAGVIAVAACLGWRFSPAGVADPSRGLLYAVGCGAAVQAAFYLADLYELGTALEDTRKGSRFLSAIGLVAAGAIPTAWLFPSAARPGLFFALAAAAAGAGALRWMGPIRQLRRRIMVVAHGEAGEVLARELADGQDEIVAHVPPSTFDLREMAREAHAEAIVVACDNRRGGLSNDTLLGCRLSGIEVFDAVDYVERTRRKLPVELVRPAALIYGDGFVRPRGVDALRRMISVGAALIMLLVALPLMVGTALAVKLTSRGPMLYRQTRVGRRGKRFRLWKFRTMRADAEAITGAVWAKEKDPRVTTVGRFLRKTRLDELPQLLNVLAGHMDLVGPRPERPEFVAELAAQIPYYDVRLLVRPGLTGWAQICYRYGGSVDDARRKLAYDLYYVRHASPLLDLIVLFHTAKVVLTARGAR